MELHRLPPPAGIAWLLRPAAVPAPPLVVMLPDALGEDGRADRYVAALLARGVASLLLGLGEEVEVATAPVEPAASPEAARAALDWARGAGFAPDRTGLLGFGLGGRAALATGEVPAIALYPGCARLAASGTAPALAIQGAEDAAGCAAAGGGRFALELLPDAGHAWDMPGAAWALPGPALPDPAGPGRRRARPDPEATRAAAEAVAGWFAARFVAP